MSIEQKIKEIEHKANRSIPDYICGISFNHQWNKRKLAKESLEVINHLQSEIERYKHLWETDSAQSKEIILELKEREKKEKLK